MNDSAKGISDTPTRLPAHRRTISGVEISTLIVVSALLHGLLWWYWQNTPDVMAEAMPTQASEASEVMVTLTSAPPPAPEPPPPPPIPEVKQTPVVDEHAVKPPEEEVVEKEPPPKPEPEPEPKPKPKPKPKPQPKPEPKPAPKPTPAPKLSQPAPQQTQQASSPQKASSAKAAQSNKVTPAVSGMQSLGNPPPSYPSLALRRGYEGNVTLQILVLPDGSAGQVQVTKSSGHRELDEAAVETVRTWRFKPAMRGSTPIKGYAIQTIAFNLPR